MNRATEGSAKTIVRTTSNVNLSSMNIDDRNMKLGERRAEDEGPTNGKEQLTFFVKDCSKCWQVSKRNGY